MIYDFAIEMMFPIIYLGCACLSPAIHLPTTLHLIRENVPSHDSKTKYLGNKSVEKFVKRPFLVKQTKDDALSSLLCTILFLASKFYIFSAEKRVVFHNKRQHARVKQCVPKPLENSSFFKSSILSNHPV